MIAAPVAVCSPGVLSEMERDACAGWSRQVRSDADFVACTYWLPVIQLRLHREPMHDIQFLVQVDSGTLGFVTHDLIAVGMM